MTTQILIVFPICGCIHSQMDEDTEGVYFVFSQIDPISLSLYSAMENLLLNQNVFKITRILT